MEANIVREFGISGPGYRIPGVAGTDDFNVEVIPVKQHPMGRSSFLAGPLRLTRAGVEQERGRGFRDTVTSDQQQNSGGIFDGALESEPAGKGHLMNFTLGQIAEIGRHQPEASSL